MKYRQREHAFAMEADDDVVVVDRFGAKMFTLNSVGGLLWNHAEHPRSADELVGVLQAQWPEMEEAQLRSDVVAFVDSALEAGILVRAES